MDIERYFDRFLVVGIVQHCAGVLPALDWWVLVFPGLPRATLGYKLSPCQGLFSASCGRIFSKEMGDRVGISREEG